jgi:hypothetical protein
MWLGFLSRVCAETDWFRRSRWDGSGGRIRTYDQSVNSRLPSYFMGRLISTFADCSPQ